ncbi:regulator of G-protein signaling 21-like, partial [Epinephelus fuscoguttatus]|uniref:regulator of G-protein signaling 21-like n=1 Tax=Epinephelus fuscoguttatus TaxID=293821 RepID=UPI0020D0C4C7
IGPLPFSAGNSLQQPCGKYRGGFHSLLCCFPKDPLDDVETWSESVDKVLSCKAGQIAFREFLKSEYSEENILFWLACEEYKKIKTVPEMISSANRIYSEFVQTEAPRQINIDCSTRENITKNISQPSLTSFDTAQKLIYSLMARDCYPRFLKSDIYQGLLRRTDSR